MAALTDPYASQLVRAANGQLVDPYTGQVVRSTGTPSDPYADESTRGPMAPTYPTTPDPGYSWTQPAYGGTDAAYAQWLAGAQLQGTNAISDAQRRRAQLDESYRQALEDLDTQSVTGRRNLQSSMLARGLFNSGETNRRKSEFDAQIAQGQSRAAGTLADQQGQVNDTERNALAALSTQGATEVSQAMLRDALATYNAQQQAASAPAAVAAPQPTYTAPAPKALTPKPGVAPVNSSAALYQAQSKPTIKASAPKAPKLLVHGLS